MNNIKHGQKKEIAAWLGLKQSFFSAIWNGKKRPSPAQAIRLESKSGILLRSWLFMTHWELRISIYDAWTQHKEI